MRLLSNVFAATLLTLVLAACGGPEDSPPGPLARHFDDIFIADVSMDQKAQMLQAQNDWTLARAEQAKAEADFKAVDSQIANVKNEREAAQLQINSALNDKKTAEASKDNNQINDATRKLHAAEMGKKAADARLKYFEAYRNYLKAHWRYTQENMYWREAQFELAKSTLAQKNGKSPRDVQYEWFPKQESERKARTDKARGKVDGAKSSAKGARDNWLSAQAAADKELGRTSTLSDPMANVQ